MIRAALPAGAAQITNLTIALERPKQAQHGDYACNVAMQLAKALRQPPRAIADGIVAALPASPYLDKAAVAGGPDSSIYFSSQPQFNRSSSTFSPLERPTGAPIVAPTKFSESVSANPTGPLHVGHGRQAALGDALSSLLQAQGYAVTREFYYNDAGGQIGNLALSVQARAKGLKPGDNGWPDAAYQGEYIADIADDFLAGKSVHAADGRAANGTADADDLESIRRRFAVAYLRNEQDIDLQKFGVSFDVYYLESSLYTDGRVDAVVRIWNANGKTFEKTAHCWPAPPIWR